MPKYPIRQPGMEPHPGPTASCGCLKMEYKPAGRLPIVKDYHKGDFDKQFSRLDIEEDFLYAHGIMTRVIWKLLHPRNKVNLSSFDKKVFDTVKDLEEKDSKILSDSFGNKKMPLLWKDKMVGWANVDKDGKVALGYAEKKADCIEFKKQLDLEINRLHSFLEFNGNFKCTKSGKQGQYGRNGNV